MMTPLDHLLESIDPSRNIDKVSERVDRALNSLRLNVSIIDCWPDFEELMTHFYCHVENMILGIEKQPFATDWTRCLEQLRKAYGPSGDKVAFDMARTGLKGGIYTVLKDVAAGMVNQYSGNEISARICRFWNNLSNNEMFEVMDEYLAKYGHLLPSELTEGSAIRIRINFTRVLEEHPRLIKRLRNAGR